MTNRRELADRLEVETVSDADAMRVGRAILDAHGVWEIENNRLGGQNPWQREHLLLLGRAAISASQPARLLREPVAGEVEDYSSSKLADEMTFLVRRLRAKGDSASADLLQTYQWRVREIDYRVGQSAILRARYDEELKGGEHGRGE